MDLTEVTPHEDFLSSHSKDLEKVFDDYRVNTRLASTQWGDCCAFWSKITSRNSKFFISDFFIGLNI